MCELIKSKDRVRDHGEVFTPQFIVNNMLNMGGIKKEAARIGARVFEPSCGEGVFLMEALRRKLAIIKRKHNTTQQDFEYYAMNAISDLYGIDIQLDNVKICRENLLSVLTDEYTNLYKSNNSYIKSIKHILNKNIICANSLELEHAYGAGVVTFAEWEFNDYNVTRNNYFFADMVGANDFLPAEPCNKKPYPATKFRQLWNQTQ